MTRPSVLVARPVFADLVERVRAQCETRMIEGDDPLTPRQLAEALRDCDGVLVTGTERIDGPLLDASPRLKAVCSMTVGYNHIDVDACTARNVLVTNTPGVLTETTADFGFALMMATARRITEGEHLLRDDRWKHWSIAMLAGADIHGTTLGILGMGRIGQAIAKRGHAGFGMRVLYHNRSRLEADVESGLGAAWVSLDDLLAKADHLVIVTPYTPQTHHLVGARELSLMKPTATLTNIARGGVVDDAALAEALTRGAIAGAGLDVFEGEPSVLPALLACTNVVLTPHIASASVPTRRAMVSLGVDNLLAALGFGPDAGRPPTPLNPEVLGRLRSVE
jgi:gluconate 2-dehydrogenase